MITNNILHITHTSGYNWFDKQCNDKYYICKLKDIIDLDRVIGINPYVNSYADIDSNVIHPDNAKAIFTRIFFLVDNVSVYDLVKNR